MSSTASATAFGQFLRSLRVNRGYSNINEYLRKYPLPVSHVHYRHLETGKRKVSVESAREMCEALKADHKSFYYYLLKDWLPANVMDLFTSLSGDHEQSINLNPDRGVSATEANLNVQTDPLDLQVLQPSRECCDYLSNNFSLMPVLWCIYAVSSASEKELEQVAQRNNISMPIRLLLNEFRHHGLIEFIGKDSDNLIVRRLSPALSFMHHDLDSKILLHETEQAVSEYQPGKDYPSNSLIYYSVVSLSANARQNIVDSIADVATSIRLASEKSSNAECEPFYYSLVFAARPQYQIKPDNQ